MSTKWELLALRVVVIVLVASTVTSGRTINVRQHQRAEDSLDGHTDDDYDGGDDTFALYNRPPNYSQLSSMHTTNKRSTIILDKIVYALQNALNKDDAGRGGGGGLNGGAVSGGGGRFSGQPSLSAEDLGPLQHRLPRDKVFWRCYFNAVSCFRRK